MSDSVYTSTSSAFFFFRAWLSHLEFSMLSSRLVIASFSPLFMQNLASVLSMPRRKKSTSGSLNLNRGCSMNVQGLPNPTLELLTKNLKNFMVL